MRLKLDPAILGLGSIIEQLARVHVKDCFLEDDVIYVVVSPGELGKAVGKGGAVVKRVQNELNKKVKIIEYHENVVEFLRNMVYPLQVEQIVDEGSAVILSDSSRAVKGQLYGREGKNLAVLQRAVSRFFPEKEVKVR